MKKVKAALLLGLFSVILPGFACSRFSEAKSSGEKGVAEFHERLNAEQFEAIYDGSAGMFKEVASKAETIALLLTVTQKLGKAGKSELTQWRVNTTTEGNFVSLTYSTRYENDTAVESFVFQINGQDVRLAGFNIDSPKLILD